MWDLAYITVPKMRGTSGTRMLLFGAQGPFAANSGKSPCRNCEGTIQWKKVYFYKPLQSLTRYNDMIYSMRP